MPVVVAVWPNSTFSIIQAPPGFAMADLFWQLDAEASPLDAKLYLLKTSDGWSHGTFDWGEADRTDYEDENGHWMKIKKASCRLDAVDGRLKRLKWPHNIVRIAYRSAFGRSPSEKPSISTMTAEEIRSMPAEPTETHSVDDVRRMKPFCGVYFAFDCDGSCHYVGESLDVTKRVSKSRVEIGERRIGLIKCQPHERKRIESYFIGLLDPPGNSQSTASQSQKEVGRRDG